VNPAVENQATDRAFRIGQTRNVQVHKFICVGTFEERIDEMIESKKDISEKVIGTGEGWLTELSNRQLKNFYAPQGSDRSFDMARRRYYNDWDWNSFYPKSLRARQRAASGPNPSAARSAKVGGQNAGSKCWKASISAPDFNAAAVTPARAGDRHRHRRRADYGQGPGIQAETIPG